VNNQTNARRFFGRLSYIRFDNEIYNNSIDSFTSFACMGTTERFSKQEITNRTMYEADLFDNSILADSGFFTDEY